MFVVTLNRARLRQIGVGAMCCAVETAAGAGSQNAKIETAQDIQTWFTGYGIEVDGASITADKVKIPRKWDDSFMAFNTVVGQSGLDLERYKGKTVEKWQALIPSASSGEESCYGVLLVYKKKPVGAYLLAKPSGLVTGLGDAQAARALHRPASGPGRLSGGMTGAQRPAWRSLRAGQGFALAFCGISGTEKRTYRMFCSKSTKI